MTDPVDPASMPQGTPPQGTPPQWTPPQGTPAQGGPPQWDPPPADGWPPLNQPVATAPPRRSRRRWIIAAVVVVLIALGGIGLYTNWQQQQNYDTGHAAYLAADCESAVPPLTKAAEGDPGSDDSDVALKAAAELQECEALTAADDLAADGDAGEAVLAYRSFVTKYPDSPLAETAMSRGQDLLASSASDAATIAVCDELDGLEDEGFLDPPDDTLPPLLYACGQAYEADDILDAALASYLRFRTDYPDHELATAVEEAYARAAVAEADQAGAGELPPPVDAGTEGGVAGQATIVIQNDSPDSLAMVFSGPDVRVEDLEPCAGCEKYAAPGPAECPSLGPVAEYIVAPGEYDVVVKSGSGADVVPFRGTWNLEAGQVYESCFYIVTGQ